LSLYPYRILFVRHGQTDDNADGRLQGRRDIPLNGKGREQASAVGRALAKELRDDLDRLEAASAFHASPLKRARRTMELVRTELGYEPTRYAVDDALVELTFGEWEGLSWDEVEARDPAGVRARQRDKWDFAPPGGESYAQLAERVKVWLAQRQGDLFLASHGGVARGLMYLLAGLDANEAANATIWQGRALLFAADGGFRWVG
jgi:probable phosphoglycerate mutase